mgnify:FL=1
MNRQEYSEQYNTRKQYGNIIDISIGINGSRVLYAYNESGKSYNPIQLTSHIIPNRFVPNILWLMLNYGAAYVELMPTQNKDQIITAEVPTFNSIDAPQRRFLKRGLFTYGVAKMHNGEVVIMNGEDLIQPRGASLNWLRLRDLLKTNKLLPIRYITSNEYGAEQYRAFIYFEIDKRGLRVLRGNHNSNHDS